MDSSQKISCPICNHDCFLHDVVDFNKSCEESKGKFLALSGIPIYYVLCEHCGFCFAPEIAKWPMEDFEKKIYNADYIHVDNDYEAARPLSNAKSLQSAFAAQIALIKHLDYGGGNGLLSKKLREDGWDSTSYDPFVNKDIKVAEVGKFNLITAYEVFEHVPDVNALMTNLQTLLAPGGVIIFSTLSSDGQVQKHQRLNWWYASPRNGHISLFSKHSLGILAGKYGFNFGSFSPGLHIFCTTVPDWANHLIK